VFLEADQVAHQGLLDLHLHELVVYTVVVVPALLMSVAAPAAVVAD
jgi:hypothetical protein